MIKPGITAIAAGAILAVLVSACGGAGSSAPQTASQILTSNGYTPVTASQSSEVATILSAAGPPASEFSSVAAGVSAKDGLGNDTSGTSTYQEVIILTPAGVSAISPTFAAVQSQDKAVGITVTRNGDVLTATGTGNAFSAISQG
jgi:hypothetical protein